MKVFSCILLAVAAKAAPEADPQLVLPYAGLAGYPYAAVAPAVAPAVTYSVPKVETEVVPTNAAVPVAVGGYKAVAGDNGELKGAVHEVPALFGAPALNTQANEGTSLTVGTSALLSAKVTGYNTHVVPGYHLIGKREAEAEADPAVVLPYAGLAGYPYAGVGYPYAAVAPAVTYSVPKVETEVVPTNAAVPVAVGGYKAVAGDNGELKGAVHEVPALFGAPALNTQTNEASQGSLTVGTSALLSAKVTGYNTHVVPGYHLIGKREAEAEPAVVLPYAGLAGYPYAGVGYPYAAVAPAVTYAVPKVETKVTATNAAVPVAVGGYKAVAGDNGELKGAVHEVPALFGAPALNTQTNEASQGSLTVGTSALVTAEVTGYNTHVVPGYHVLGKREAEADPAVLYSTLGYNYPTYSAYSGYPFVGAYGWPYLG